MNSSISPVESLEDLRLLFEMMGTYGIAVCELPGVKIVKAPDTAPTSALRSEGHEISLPNKNLHDDPFLYPDGRVPSFERT